MLSLEETAMFAAGFFTANTGRAMVTMQGVENVEGIDVNIFNANIEAARDHVGTTTYLGQGEAARRGISSVEYGKYAGSAYQRMRMILEDPALYDQMLATLPPDQRAGLEAGAELLGRFMYEIRRSRLGEPDDPAATLAACVDAARRIIVAKGYAENGELAFTFFTYGERQYMLGTNMITTHDFARWKPAGGWNFEDPEFQRRHGNEGFYNLVFVPSETPGQVLVVGVIDGNDNLQMLSEPVQYALDWRDSVGLAGFTRRWCHNLPLINVGGPIIEIPSPDFKGVNAPIMSLEEVRPPTVIDRQITGNFDLIPADYGAGALIDDAVFTIENVRLGEELVPSSEVFSLPNVWMEYNNFRRVASNRYFATAAREVTSIYADTFESPSEIQNVAEFASDGNVYVYMRGGKLVDADRQAGEEGVRRVRVGTYAFTLDAEGEKIVEADVRVAPQFRGLIFARLGQAELEAKLAEETASMTEYRMEINLTTQSNCRAGERVLPFVTVSTGPIPGETGMEIAGTRTLAAAEVYDGEGFMLPRAERIAAIDARFLEIRSLYGETISVEMWTDLKAEMVSLREERETLLREMLDHTRNAIAEVERRGILISENSKSSLEGQARALEANLTNMEERWAAWASARDDVDRKLGLI